MDGEPFAVAERVIPSGYVIADFAFSASDRHMADRDGAGYPAPFISHAAPEGHPIWSPDGQRFLINTPTEDASTSPITVILNWAGRKK